MKEDPRDRETEELLPPKLLPGRWTTVGGWEPLFAGPLGNLAAEDTRAPAVDLSFDGSVVVGYRDEVVGPRVVGSYEIVAVRFSFNRSHEPFQMCIQIGALRWQSHGLGTSVLDQGAE